MMLFCFYYTVSNPTVSVEVFGLLVAGLRDPVTLNCSAKLSIADDFGVFIFQFTWLYRDYSIIPSNRIKISSDATRVFSLLSLSPLSIEDDNFTCMVRAREKFNRVRISDSGIGHISLNVTGTIKIIV